MSTPLSERLAQAARDLEDADEPGTLDRAIETAELADALHHAAAVAAEVEAYADRTAWWTGVRDLPAYPPLVSLLGRAASARADDEHATKTRLTTCSDRDKAMPTGTGEGRRAVDATAPAAPRGMR